MTTADFSTARWRKSSHSSDDGACVEVAFAAADWRKSSRSSSGGSCVEVAHTGLVAGLRDSKNPAGGLLAVNAGAFADLVRTARAR